MEKKKCRKSESAGGKKSVEMQEGRGPGGGGGGGEGRGAIGELLVAEM